MSARNAVSLVNAVRTFSRGPEMVRAVDNVTVDLEPGHLTVVAGPSGSGKTTLLSLVARLEQPNGGSVRVGELGLQHVGDQPPPWRHIGFAPQAPSLLAELTIRENIDLPALLDPAAPHIADDQLLDSMDIAHLADRFPAQVSGGEQQRTAIARALRLRPPVLLADEPTAHQDRRRIALILNALTAHAHAGNVVVVTSHDPDVISAAERVIWLADKKTIDQPQHRGGEPR